MMEKFGLELVTLCPANEVLRPFEMAKGSVCLCGDFSHHAISLEIIMEMWDTHLSCGEFPAEITKLSTASRLKKTTKNWIINRKMVFALHTLMQGSTLKSSQVTIFAWERIQKKKKLPKVVK